MGLFGALVIGAFGLGLYALAVLVWDRRRHLARQWAAIHPERRSVPLYLVTGALVLGSGLLVASAIVTVGALGRLMNGTFLG